MSPTTRARGFARARRRLFLNAARGCAFSTSLASTHPRRAVASQGDSSDAEQQQTLEQWLRQVPDDPGGLLRRLVPGTLFEGFEPRAAERIARAIVRRRHPPGEGSRSAGALPCRRVVAG